MGEIKVGDIFKADLHHSTKFVVKEINKRTIDLARFQNGSYKTIGMSAEEIYKMAFVGNVFYL